MISFRIGIKVRRFVDFYERHYECADQNSESADSEQDLGDVIERCRSARRSDASENDAEDSAEYYDQPVDEPEFGYGCVI